MITLLAKKFIKNYKDYKDAKVRESYGTLTGIVGICLNLILFACKFTVGAISGVISITADAFNNLTDAGSSLIAFIGFKLANKPTDRDHPFGHGRIEYVAGFIVSIIIFLVGYELLKTSIDKLINPTASTPSYYLIIVLGLSILVKLYMFYYNKKIGEKIDSSVLRATSTDSISDCLATSVVVLSVIVNYLFHIQVDGIVGIIIVAFIWFTGYKSAKETIGLLLGQAPDGEYVKSIEKTVLESKYVLGIHDLIVHNYGPSSYFITFHAEVPSNCDINDVHDEIDDIEHKLEKTYKCIAVIHMDPIVVDDDKLNEMKVFVQNSVAEIDPQFKIHDFRMTQGATHTNLIFDLVITRDTKMTNEQILQTLKQKIKSKDNTCNVVCQIEYSYID